MEQTDKINEIISEEEEDTQDGKFLTFSLGSEEYGIEIRYVTEIIGIQNITDLPDMPTFVKGVINLRGKVIPVIDVRLRFNLPAKEYNERTCIIVVRIDNIAVGLIVDSVSEVLDIAEDDIEPAPKVKKSQDSRFIQGLGKVEGQVKILLDVQSLLLNRELQTVEESNAA
jgi:purine-binding chemotaxis protein CheW